MSGFDMAKKNKLKILVIEDDEFSRDALAHLLSAEGYQTLSAHDGESGLAQAHDELPDLIIVDLDLPGINGKQVIETIRGDGSLSETPILVVTGAEAKEAEMAVEAGANSYLTKPIEFDHLIGVLSDLSASSAVA
jgi:DNA-binding response OmpR family regulator